MSIYNHVNSNRKDWERLITNFLDKHGSVYHDWLKTQLKKDIHKPYTSIEEWKQDITKLLLKNI